MDSNNKEINDRWDKVSQCIMEAYREQFNHFPTSIDLLVSDGSLKIETHLKGIQSI